MSSFKKPEGLPNAGDLPRPPAKAMSSRLLTMKFMQRATASALSKSASPSTIPTIATATGMTTTSDSSPSTTKTKASSVVKQAKRDHAALQAALAEEERNRQEAVRRRAEETGDSMWELSLVPRPQGKDGGKTGLGRVEVVGYAEVLAGEDADEDEPWGVERMKLGSKVKSKLESGIKLEINDDAEEEEDDEGEEDSEDDDEDDDDDNEEDDEPSTPVPTISGRLTFGNFTRHKPPPPPSEPKPSASSDSDSDPESKPPPRRDANPLRNATSISGNGNKPHVVDKRECYNCGAVGHIAAECPMEKMKGRKREREREREDSTARGEGKKVKTEKWKEGRMGFSGSGRGAGGGGYAGVGKNKGAKGRSISGPGRR